MKLAGGLAGAGRDVGGQVQAMVQVGEHDMVRDETGAVRGTEA